jgi:hypothetical protein
MKRTILHFSLRSKEALALQAISNNVARAFGCEFREGSYHKIPALMAEILGMEIALYEWGELSQERIFQRIFVLVGDVVDMSFVRTAREEKTEQIEFIANDISSYIIDLLEVREAGQWYIPSLDQIEDEGAYSYRVESYFEDISEERLEEQIRQYREQFQQVKEE